MSAFVLHVELTCPDRASADGVLAGLARCAESTRSAGPGVPVYLFHPSDLVADLAQARIPGAAGLEYFELYLDGPAFWRHADSEEFLSGFRIATNKQLRLQRRVYYAGAPPADVMERSLLPHLRAEPLVLMTSILFDAGQAKNCVASEYLSLHVAPLAGEDDRVRPVVEALANQGSWVSLLVFAAPSAGRGIRMMGVRRAGSIADGESELWTTAVSLAREVRGTSIGPGDLPSVGAQLAGASNCRVRRLTGGYSGYTLHPDAGDYLPLESE